MNKLTFILIMTFVFTSMSPLYAAEYPWQLRTSKEGISVYTRKVENSPILEFKATLILDAPLTTIIPLFEDVNKLTSWYYQCTSSELIKDEDEHNKVLYIVLHLPWPVAQRDSIFRRTKSSNNTNGSISYSIQALPDLLPVKKGKIRVLMINSLWRFTPLAEGKTEISFSQHSDPGGSIPAFLVNEEAVDTPFESLKSFRQLIMKASLRNE